MEEENDINLDFNPNFKKRELEPIDARDKQLKKSEMKKKKKKEKEKEEEEASPASPPASPASPPAPPSPLKKLEQSVKSILTQALQPLYEFINMVEASSGVKMWYRYVEDKKRETAKIPLVSGCKTVEEFREKNWFLGETLLDILLMDIDTNIQPINATYTFQRALYRANLGKGATRYEIENAPQFIWCLLPDSVFQLLLEKSYGALILAADELGFPLKDLILSKHVRSKYAEYVARKYIAPRQNGYASMAQGGGMAFRIASGANTTKMSNVKVLLGAKEFFRHVTYVAEDDVEEFRRQADIQIQTTLLGNVQPVIPEYQQKLRNAAANKRAICQVLKEAAERGLREDANSNELKRAVVKYRALSECLNERGVLK